MRVCQFRHYGTVSYAPVVELEHVNRESLVLQRLPPLSILRTRERPIAAAPHLLQKNISIIMDHQDHLHPPTPTGPDPSLEIPEDLAVEMRRLAHDLSNALEIIVQTSYLLSTTEMKEPASDWLRMLDGGVQKALDINMDLRTYIKAHSPS